MKPQRKGRTIIVPLYDPVEREAERAWEKRELEFALRYPEYRRVAWKDASAKARQVALEKAKKDLLSMGVAV